MLQTWLIVMGIWAAVSVPFVILLIPQLYADEISELAKNR